MNTILRWARVRRSVQRMFILYYILRHHAVSLYVCKDNIVIGLGLLAPANIRIIFLNDVYVITKYIIAPVSLFYEKTMARRRVNQGVGTSAQRNPAKERFVPGSRVRQDGCPYR